MNRDEALVLLKEYTQSESLIGHALSVEAAMRHYAERLEGDVDHRDEVLDDLERESKLQVCVSRALPGGKIILDL